MFLDFFEFQTVSKELKMFFKKTFNGMFKNVPKIVYFFYWFLYITINNNS